MRRADFLAGTAASGAVRFPGRRMLRVDALPLGHGIDPYRDAQQGVDELAWLYADGLVGWNGGPIPLLAARLPDVLDGGRRYRYSLRRVRWHDGRPLVAKDVAEAFASVRATQWGTHHPYRSVLDVHVRGDHDFDVVLDSPQPGFLRAFFGAYGTPALPLLRGTSVLPIGTGPFRVQAQPEPERWRLERVDSSPRGIPRADGIELRLLSSEYTAGVQLQSGEADIAIPLAPDVARSDRFVQVPRFTSVAVLLLNTARVFRTVESRRAFAASVNVPRIQHAYDLRRKTPFASLLMAGENDRNLQRALVHDRGAGATLRRAIGVSDLTIAYVARKLAHDRVATVLQQELRLNAGVPCELRGVPAAAYLQPLGPLRAGTFDVGLYGFTYGDALDLGADWACANQPPAGGNFARWCDAPTEAALARKAPRDVLRRLYDAVACIPLTRAYEVLGVSPGIRGFSAPTPMVPATYGCADWSSR